MTTVARRSCSGAVDRVGEVDPVVVPVELGGGVGAWFTGRDRGAAVAVGRAGNLSHRRPHVPERLAADRVAAFRRMGLDAGEVHLMRQVHGARVGVVTVDTPPGSELGPADILVTAVPGRALAVQVADCVPLLLAGRRTVAAVHAGRVGLTAGVVDRAVDALEARGEDPVGVRAAIGPAIGGCCYEVPEDLRARLGAIHAEVTAETSWGTPSLDLPCGVEAALRQRGVDHVERTGGCTRCDPQRRWFSHRADPETGRQLGVVALGEGGL